LTSAPGRVLVLGGGITGLVACHRLIEGARKRNIPLEVCLLEASGRFGGTIQTVREADCLMEMGPDCFLTVKPEGVALCRELGLENRLIGTNPDYRRSFILRNGRLLPVPQGFYLLAPSSLLPFLTTPIFSPLGKLRMGLDLILPRRKESGDETLASFVRRRLGREALERMAQPMIAGIYSADPEELSLEATMPQFLEMERDYRSVILGLRARGRQMARRQQSADASGPRYGLFMTLDTGLKTLVDSLLERIPSVALRAGMRAGSLHREDDRWQVEIEGNGRIAADGVILALPAGPAGALVREISPKLAETLGNTPYGSVATINFVLRRDQVAHSLDGMGFVVPAIEGKTLMACSFSSSKFAGRAPEGKVLLRAFVGGAHPHFDLPDEELTQKVLEELRALLQIQGEPEAARLQRYRGAMVQYRIGHLDRVRQLEEELTRIPGLALAGSAYRGVGIPDCAASATQAATRLLDQLAARAS
jgi:oxygen-dependent protoporphyrinogen oxidase